MGKHYMYLRKGEGLLHSQPIMGFFSKASSKTSAETSPGDSSSTNVEGQLHTEGDKQHAKSAPETPVEGGVHPQTLDSGGSNDPGALDDVIAALQTGAPEAPVEEGVHPQTIDSGASNKDPGAVDLVSDSDSEMGEVSDSDSESDDDAVDDVTAALRTVTAYDEINRKTSDSRILKGRVSTFDCVAKRILVPHLEASIGGTLQLETPIQGRVQKKREHDERSKVLWNVVRVMVRWKGWPADDTTWEPRSHLHDAAEALDLFESKLRASEGSSQGGTSQARGVEIDGVRVRVDTEGKPDWLSKGHELIGKQLCKDAGTSVGNVVKFVYDPRQSGAQPALFCVQFDDDVEWYANEKQVRVGMKRKATMDREERKKRSRR